MSRIKEILNQQSVKIVLVYVIISAIWIAFTDQLEEQFISDPGLITQIQTFKGWFFVIASGLLILWIVNKSRQQIEINRDQYKVMLDNAKVGIAKMVNGKVVSPNPAFQQIIGRDTHELENEDFLEFIDKFDRTELTYGISTFEYGNYLERELRLTLKRNKKQWVQVNISRHKDRGGEYFQLILQDINDRKTYQAYNDLLLQMMLSLEPAGDFRTALGDVVKSLCKELNWEYGVALTSDKEGTFKKNVSWYMLDPLLDEFDAKVEMYRFKKGEGLAGVTLDTRQAIWIEKIKNDERYHYRQDALDADLNTVVSIPVQIGEEVIALLILYHREILAPDRELLKLFTAIGRDVASKLEKQKEEDEKKKLEQSLSFALKSAGMATWDMDLETGEVITSQNHYEVFGLKKAPETWNVDDALKKIIKEDREKVRQNLVEAASNTKEYNVEFRIKHNDSIRWLWSRGNLQYDSYGEAERLSGVVSDFTERKHLQIYTELLLQIILSIEPIKDLTSAYKNILEVICSQDNWQFGEVWEYGGVNGLMERVASHVIESDHRIREFDLYSNTFVSRPENGLPFISASTGELQWISDIGNDERFLRSKKAVEAGLRSAVAIPVVVDGQTTAVLIFFSKYTLRRDENTVRFFDAIRNNIGIKLESKRAEEQLKKAEKSLEYALISSSMAAWDIDLETGSLTMSENYEEVTGITMEDDVYDESLSRVIDEDREALKSHLNDAIKNKGKIEYEFRVLNDHNEVRWLRTQGHFSEADGKSRISGIIRDVTDTKKVELDLEREREFLEQLFETIPVMITIYRPDLSQISVNAEFERATGWTNDEIKHIDLVAEVYPDEKYRNEALDFMENPGSSWKEMEMVTKSGDKIQSTWTNIKLSDQTQIGIGLDITEQKKLREQIEAEREELLKIFNNMPIFINIHDDGDGKAAVNDFFEERLGYSVESIKHDDLLKLITTEEGYEAAKKHISKSDGSWKDFELITKEGEQLQSTWTNIQLSETKSIGIGLDITERKRMELKLEEERRRFESAAKTVSDVIWDWDIKTRKMWWSEGYKTHFGYDPKHEPDGLKSWSDYIHKDDLVQILEKFHEVVDSKNKNEWEGQYRFLNAKGEIRDIEDRGIVLRDNDGKPLRMIGAMIDITDLKRAREEVETERRRFETAAEVVSDVVWDYDAVKNTLWWNEGIEAVFGYSRKNILNDHTFWEEHIHEDDRERIIKSIRKAETSDALEWRESYRFLNAEGNVREIEDSAILIRDDEGNLLRIIGAMLDVTELKSVQKRLSDERARFESIAKLTNDVIYDFELNSEEFWSSEGLQTVMGYNPELYSGPLEWWKENLYPDDRKRLIQSLENAIESDVKEWTEEYRFLNGQGKTLHILQKALFIRDEDAGTIRMLGAMIDVTAEKEAERILRESEEQYRRLFEQNPYPMWIFDPDTHFILQVNQSAVDKYGYTRHEFKEMTMYDFWPENEKEKLKSLFKNKQKGLKYYEGWTHLDKEGTKIIVNINALDIQYKGKECRLIVANDITKQRKAEERAIGSIIEGSENERRRIAKELHDGLGQQLAAASMNLESVYDELQRLPEVKWNQYKKGLKLLSDAIVESRRISQNLLPKAIEDFGLSLAVQSLIDDVGTSLDIDITYRDNIEGVKFPDAIELNMYRVIQEGLNNAIRHSGTEKIDVQLILDEKSLICTIEDAGKGFDLNRKKASGFGLSSINNRVNAMAGEVEISSKKRKGTIISVIVPVNPL